MPKKKVLAEDDLLSILLASVEIVKLQQDQPLSSHEIKKLIETFEQNYPGNQLAQLQAWEAVRPLLTLVSDWLEANAQAGSVWRNKDNRVTDTLNIFTNLVTNYNGSEKFLVQHFDSEVVPRLEKRRNDLTQWMHELWDLEKTVRYSIKRTLEEQVSGYPLDDSFIDLAFVEKVDHILLNYDPARSGHASLKGYAVFLIYRQLLDKVRRTGYNDFKTVRIEENRSADRELPETWNKATQISTPDIREAALAVCRAAVAEVENPAEKTNRLNKLRVSLVYLDFLEQIIKGSEANSLSVQKALALLLTCFDSTANAPVYLELKKFNINADTSLQTLHNALSLENNSSQRVQLSQARRILTTHLSLQLTVERFIDIAPYPRLDKARLKQAPLKIIDYCFKGLSRFNDWKQVETHGERL